MHKTERKIRALCCRAAAKPRTDLQNEEKLRCKRKIKLILCCRSVILYYNSAAAAAAKIQRGTFRVRGISGREVSFHEVSG